MLQYFTPTNIIYNAGLFSEGVIYVVENNFP